MNAETGMTMMPRPMAGKLSKIETASTAAAAAARAEVEAMYVMALHNPRDIERTRVAILDACRRPQFAQAAIYRKPVGKKYNDDTRKWEQQFIEDLSIRAAEEMLRRFRNVRVDGMTTYEDADIRKKRICITDLETNLSYSREITLTKTVERRGKEEADGKVTPPADRTVLGQRLNSWGKTVFIVEATEDELIIKEAALTSKIIRTEGLRLIPADIKDEAKELCYATMASEDAKDPKAAMRKLIDGFHAIGVEPNDIAAYLGHTVESVQPAELADLRKIYRSISDGEAKWAQYVDKSEPVEPVDKPGAKVGKDVLGKKHGATAASAERQDVPPADAGPADDQPATMPRDESERIISTAPRGAAARALAKRDLTPENWREASDEILADVASLLVQGAKK